MINYFNKKSPVNDIPNIEWNEWKDKIATVGLVEKVQKNYETLRTERYDVEKVADQLATTESKDLNDINRELAFHAYYFIISAMWMNNYCDYQNFLFELEEYGDNDYLSKNII